MQTVDIELLRNNVAFTLTRKKFGNTKKIRSSEVRTDAAEGSRVRASKVLLVSDEMDAIHRALDEVYTWCVNRCAKSYFKEGLYLVRLSMVEEFERKLKACEQEILPPLIREFQRRYPEQIEQAREDLNGLFNIKDYPDQAQLPGVFGLKWNWISFGVPENLPAELREIEAGKLQAQFQEAEQEIVAALREGFSKVLFHLTDRLETKPGEQPKQFKNSLFENLTEFIETFNARNLMNDQELEGMVTRAKQILSEVRGNSPADQAAVIRDSRLMRERVAGQLAELKTQIDAGLVDRKSRKFQLED